MSFRITEVARLSKTLFSRTLFSGTLLFRSPLLRRVLVLPGRSRLPGIWSRSVRGNKSASNMALILAFGPAPLSAAPVLRKAQNRNAWQE